MNAQPYHLYMMRSHCLPLVIIPSRGMTEHVQDVLTDLPFPTNNSLVALHSLGR